MRIETAINQGFKELKKNNIKSPLLDSEIIMSKVLNKGREYLILNHKDEINSIFSDRYKKLIKERLLGKPVAYLVGKKFFWEYEFLINKKVLIPRPDTELIVDQVLRIYKNKSKINFLEIGVGSGCIILSILKERDDFKGSGIDISSECIKTCKINAYNLKIKNRLKLSKSDIDNFHYGKYDLIISNPPYVKSLNLKNLDKDVVNFEPKLALNGGLDGLSVIRKVINKSSNLIKKNGKLIIEIAFDQKKVVKDLLKEKGFYVNKVIKDLSKNDRCIVSTKI